MNLGRTANPSHQEADNATEKCSNQLARGVQLMREAHLSNPSEVRSPGGSRDGLDERRCLKRFRSPGHSFADSSDFGRG
jgi:hypothetical protein